MKLLGIVGESYRKDLYASEGCCMNLNSWRHEPIQNRTIVPITSCRSRIPSLMQKFLRCLGAQFMSRDCIYLALSQLKGELIKDGMTEDEVDPIIIECIDKFTSHRSKFSEEFMR